MNTESELQQSKNRLEEILENAQELTPELATTISSELISRNSISLENESVKDQLEILTSRSKQIISEDELEKILEGSKKNKKPLRVKFGIDPTGADVHIGHAVPMIVASRLQRMGHQIILIIGDTTALIGDPSDSTDERPMLTVEQINNNLSSYTKQISPIFDLTTAENRRNSEWLNNLNAVELLKILSKIPVSMQLQRDDFRKRIESGQGVTNAEFMYSIFMAYDSVAVDADIELGGIDQLLNLQMCRKVMEVKGLKPEVIITTALIEGTDGSGAKMSKSKGNYIGLNSSSDDIYGKTMSVPDNLFEDYFKSLSDISNSEWDIIATKLADNSFHPMMVKKMLAEYLTTLIHDDKLSIEARDNFIAQFDTAKKDSSMLTNIEEVEYTESKNLLECFFNAEFYDSKGNGRRLANSNSIKLIDTENNDEETVLSLEELLLPISESLSKLSTVDGKLLIKIGKQLKYIKFPEEFTTS